MPHEPVALLRRSGFREFDFNGSIDGDAYDRNSQRSTPLRRDDRVVTLFPLRTNSARRRLRLG